MDNAPNPLGFIRSFWPNWWALMSGAPSIPFTYWGLWHAQEDQKSLFLTLAGVSIILAAYFVWANERGKVRSLQEQLDKIGQQRNLYYQNANLVARPTEIDVGLIFENLGDLMLWCELSEVFISFGQLRFDVPQNMSAAHQGYIHAKKDIRFNFIIRGFTLPPNGPAAITLGFTAKYDNTPPVRARFCERHILYEFDNLQPLQFRQSTITRQREW